MHLQPRSCGLNRHFAHFPAGLDFLEPSHPPRLRGLPWHGADQVEGECVYVCVCVAGRELSPVWAFALKLRLYAMLSVWLGTLISWIEAVCVCCRTSSPTSALSPRRSTQRGCPTRASRPGGGGTRPARPPAPRQPWRQLWCAVLLRAPAAPAPAPPFPLLMQPTSGCWAALGGWEPRCSLGGCCLHICVPFPAWLQSTLQSKRQDFRSSVLQGLRTVLQQQQQEQGTAAAEQGGGEDQAPLWVHHGFLDAYASVRSEVLRLLETVLAGEAAAPLTDP